MLHDDWSYYDQDNVDAITEVKRRKPLFATDERLDRALSLLRQLELDPASTPRKPGRRTRTLAAST